MRSTIRNTTSDLLSLLLIESIHNMSFTSIVRLLIFCIQMVSPILDVVYENTKFKFINAANIPLTTASVYNCFYLQSVFNIRIYESEWDWSYSISIGHLWNVYLFQRPQSMAAKCVSILMLWGEYLLFIRSNRN